MMELVGGPTRVLIDPERGGRVASIQIDGLEILTAEREDPLRWGLYPMAPFAGRVRGGRFRFGGREYALPRRMPPHAIHGTTLDRAWQETGPDTLSIDLGEDWPFPGTATQRFSLDERGFEIELGVAARDQPYPASLGLHPWFARELGRGRPLELDFRARTLFLRDAEGIPTTQRVAPPARPWDDCFTDLEASPRLTWPDALSIRIEATTPYWVVYDEPTDAICVEPVTQPPDALNVNPTLVSPERPLTLTTRIEWTLH